MNRVADMDTPAENLNGTVQVLIADNTENDAYAIDSLLRSAGIVTRLRYIDDLSLAADHVQNADLMLLETGLEDAERAIPAIRELNPRLPIILLRGDAEPAALPFASVDTALKLGASDMVHRSHQTHLLRSCQRELEAQCLTAKLVQNKRALSEAEQRCQLLLQSASAAIAYVHEGMHIYANDAYLSLFSFADADDLIGLPLIDLIAESSIETLRTALKTFRTTKKGTSFDIEATNGEGEVFPCSITLEAA
ncbi:MAG: PAS domain-containing protein, partial [Pseudomonadota bacterium]